MLDKDQLRIGSMIKSSKDYFCMPIQKRTAAIITRLSVKDKVVDVFIPERSQIETLNLFSIIDWWDVIQY